MQPIEWAIQVLAEQCPMQSPAVLRGRQEDAPWGGKTRAAGAFLVFWCLHGPVVSSLAVMDNKKKVHAYVRVKPTDDFAHEMITYGDDNKVSAVYLPSAAWASAA